MDIAYIHCKKDGKWGIIQTEVHRHCGLWMVTTVPPSPALGRKEYRITHGPTGWAAFPKFDDIEEAERAMIWWEGQIAQRGCAAIFQTFDPETVKAAIPGSGLKELYIEGKECPWDDEIEGEMEELAAATPESVLLEPPCTCVILGMGHAPGCAWKKWKLSGVS